LINIIGAGLAGCEAAYQIAKRGHDVTLHEMKPDKMSPAHKLAGPAELVCSNSLGADREGSAPGLLKAELRMLDCLILKAAEEAKVPAGQALAVNREKMSENVAKVLGSMPNIKMVSGEVTDLPEGDTIIATGPLTSDALAEKIGEMAGQRLFFFDATSPIVTTESIDQDKVFAASRYDRGDADYLNCPFSKEEYFAFLTELKSAKLVQPRDFEKFSVFEGCMPIEVIAARGDMTLAFGAMKPVGLPDPKTGKEAFAVVQLRREDAMGDSHNLVGFQTRMTFGEQERIFRMIPGLENAEFLRLGVMHRNTYIETPKVLGKGLELKSEPRIRFAGQITGVEGYVESTASGLLCALLALNPTLPQAPETTMIGALHKYVTGYDGKDFQPMAANFGLVPPLGRKMKKKFRKIEYHNRGVADMQTWIAKNSL